MNHAVNVVGIKKGISARYIPGTLDFYILDYTYILDFYKGITFTYGIFTLCWSPRHKEHLPTVRTVRAFVRGRHESCAFRPPLPVQPPAPGSCAASARRSSRSGRR